MQFLVVAAGDLKEGHEQDVFHLSLPSSRVKYLYVQGPMTPVECNVELIRKYDTSFDLFDAAAKCEVRIYAWRYLQSNWTQILIHFSLNYFYKYV